MAVKYEIPMDIFWKSTPKKLSRYFKYGEKKREQKDKDLDFLAWNIGTYKIGRAHV